MAASAIRLGCQNPANHSNRLVGGSMFYDAPIGSAIDRLAAVNIQPCVSYPLIELIVVRCASFAFAGTGTGDHQPTTTAGCLSPSS